MSKRGKKRGKGAESTRRTRSRADTGAAASVSEALPLASTSEPKEAAPPVPERLTALSARLQPVAKQAVSAIGVAAAGALAPSGGMVPAGREAMDGPAQKVGSAILLPTGEQSDGKDAAGETGLLDPLPASDAALPLGEWRPQLADEAARPEATGGRFIPERLLGAGGMCEVYAAVDLRRVDWSDATPQVAVKRLLPELRENRHAQIALAQEFFTLRHLVHPGVVRAFDLHCEFWGVCYTMELLQGATLQERLADLPGGYAGDGTRLAVRLLEALAYLHRTGVVHADIKPGNVFMAPEGRVVLIDFNIAQVSVLPGAACAPVAQGLRQSLHLPAHSLLYASPERLETGCPSMADDIFAVAATVYEMVSGTHPFGRRTANEAMKEGLVPTRPPGLAQRPWSALRQALDHMPAARPSAQDLLSAFTTRGLIPNLLNAVLGQ